MAPDWLYTRDMRVVALSAALLLPFAVSAQALGGLDLLGGSPFSVSVEPQYPAPYGQASLSFTSTSIDLTRATLTVTVNGKETYKGPVHTISVSLGKAGSVTKVKLSVSQGGSPVTQTISIQPEEVALIAEPIASVPPLYPGKASVPLEGQVRVVAVAHLADASGKAGGPSTYSYAWTVDGARIADASGIGKSALIIDSPLQYRAREVSVVVTNSSGSLVGGDTVTLQPVDPVVRLYENDPLLGIRFDHALLGRFSIADSEMTLYAAPFSLPTTSGAPTIQWFLNGAAAQTGSSITLRPTGSGQGSAALSLTASAGQYTTATANLSLIFGAKSGNNLFGL